MSEVPRIQFIDGVFSCTTETGFHSANFAENRRESTGAQIGFLGRRWWRSFFCRILRHFRSLPHGVESWSSGGFQPSMTHSCELSRAQGCRSRCEFSFRVTRHTSAHLISPREWTYTPCVRARVQNNNTNDDDEEKRERERERERSVFRFLRSLGDAGAVFLVVAVPVIMCGWRFVVQIIETSAIGGAAGAAAGGWWEVFKASPRIGFNSVFGSSVCLETLSSRRSSRRPTTS